MKQFLYIAFAILGLNSLCAATLSFDIQTKNKSVSEDITATINKETSQKELDDLKNFLSEKGIDFLLKNVKYNEQKEIVAISIILKKGDTKSNYSVSSNYPISPIVLGHKDGQLFIENNNMTDQLSSRLKSAFQSPNFAMDSIMKHHGFSFNFDDASDSLLLKGHIDISKLKDQLMNAFSFTDNDDGSFSIKGKLPQSVQKQKMHKYNFVNSPKVAKLILIDGKESDFETLDKLAKSDQLDEVDFLKPQTAISVYGKKAKDGAIIATTLK